MAGLPKKDLDGESIKKIVNDPKTSKDRTIFSYFDKGNFAVISKSWRLIQYSDGTQELYNRLNDPHEYQNLIKNKEYESIVKELQSHLPNWQ